MATLDHDIILQTETADGVYRCQGFSGVPAARRAWICLQSSGAEDTLASVNAVSTELMAVLLGSSPAVALSEMPCGVTPNTFRPVDYPDRKKVLMLLGSPDHPIPDRPWYETWRDEAQESSVMTAIPPGDFPDMFAASIRQQDPPHWLMGINASRWQKRPAEVLAGLMARAEITSAASRVFLSYRRLEAHLPAVQLFDRLTHEGFEIFLDRFSIPEGLDFQRRLRQELEDKSMVVLLESKFLKDSKWTQHEIDFAKQYRLGLATVRMPDVRESDRIVSTTIGTHLDLQASDFVGGPRLVSREGDPGSMYEWPELREEALVKVVAAIKQAHAEALFDRRHRLRNDLRIALRSAGLEPGDEEVGPLLVGHGANEHMIWITTRPPELSDFQGIYAAHVARYGETSIPRGLIIGPRAAQEPDRLARLQWLHRITESLSFDEARLDDFAQRVASGTWH